MSAGKLRERLTFQRRSVVDNVSGNTDGPLVDFLTTAARVRPLRGAETVLAKKLKGVLTYEIKIRSSTLSRTIATEDRAIDVRDPGRVFNIRSISNDDEHREYLTLIADTGVTT